MEEEIQTPILRDIRPGSPVRQKISHRVLVPYPLSGALSLIPSESKALVPNGSVDAAAEMTQWVTMAEEPLFSFGY